MRRLNRFQTAALGCGAVACCWPVVYAISIDVGEELASSMVGSLILFGPYLGLARWTSRSLRWLRWAALGVLLACSGLLWLLAGSDAQGAIAVIYVVPAQWAAVAATRFGRVPRS